MKFNEPGEQQARQKALDAYGNGGSQYFQAGRRSMGRGRAAVWQARLILLVMINLAQLWILSATVEAALAREFKQLAPLVISSGVCWLIALTIFLWWKPTSRQYTSSGFVRKK